MRNGFNVIGSKHKVFTYQLKEGRKCSYYQVDGDANILPNRISISFDGLFKPIYDSGTKRKVGQMKAQFKKNETSTYKRNEPFNFHSTIYGLPHSPIVFGWADIGVTNERKKVSTTGDLLIVQKQGKLATIHLFEGMADKVSQALDYLEVWQKRKGQ